VSGNGSSSCFITGGTVKWPRGLGSPVCPQAAQETPAEASGNVSSSGCDSSRQIPPPFHQLHPGVDNISLTA
jgi:hypothetical protein